MEKPLVSVVVVVKDLPSEAERLVNLCRALAKSDAAAHAPGIELVIVSDGPSRGELELVAGDLVHLVTEESPNAKIALQLAGDPVSASAVRTAARCALNDGVLVASAELVSIVELPDELDLDALLRPALANPGRALVCAPPYDWCSSAACLVRREALRAFRFRPELAQVPRAAWVDVFERVASAYRRPLRVWRASARQFDREGAERAVRAVVELRRLDNVDAATEPAHGLGVVD